MVRIFFSFRLPSLRFFFFYPGVKSFAQLQGVSVGALGWVCSETRVQGMLVGAKIGIGNGLDRALAR